MVIDNPTGLQVGEYGDGAEILETPFFQGGAHPIGQLIFCFPASMLVLSVNISVVVGKGP